MFSVDLLARPEHLLALGVAIAVVVYALFRETPLREWSLLEGARNRSKRVWERISDLQAFHPVEIGERFSPGPHWFLGDWLWWIAFSGYRFRRGTVSGPPSATHSYGFFWVAALCCCSSRASRRVASAG